MTVVTLHRMVDGPIALDVANEERIDKIGEMAAELVETGAFADHGDSVMVLLAKGHPPFEVYALLADARQAAREIVVAAEMSEP